jgi:hypothetical protein
VSHELKTKGDKVSTLRKLGEGYGEKKKNRREAESGEKINGKKKERVIKEECVEKVGKNLNFFAKSSDLKYAYVSELPMILLVYKEVYFNSDNLDSSFPSLLKFFYRNLKMSF